MDKDMIPDIIQRRLNSRRTYLDYETTRIWQFQEDTLNFDNGAEEEKNQDEMYELLSL